MPMHDDAPRSAQSDPRHFRVIVPMSSRPSIDIAFQTDDGHAWMTGIAVRSLITAFARSLNSKTYRLRIFFISHGLNETHRALLDRSSASDSVEVRTEIVDCPLGAATPDERRIELFTLRLQFAQVLPHLDRVLFLDSDILVMDDIAKLWETDLKGHWLGAAACLVTSDEVCLRNYNNEFKIQFNGPNDPINGGVMLLDLRRMREQQIGAVLTDWLNLHRATIYNPDQEAISMHCAGRFTVLPPEWNYRLFAEPYWTSSWRGFREYIGLKPSIVHFQNPLRPNVIVGALPYFTEWIACHDDVNQKKLTGAKPMDYFMFVYFEFYVVMTMLATGIASYRWRAFLTGVFLSPYALLKYAQYRLAPARYRFAIWNRLPDAEPARLDEPAGLAPQAGRCGPASPTMTGK